MSPCLFPITRSPTSVDFLCLRIVPSRYPTRHSSPCLRIMRVSLPRISQHRRNTFKVRTIRVVSRPHCHRSCRPVPSGQILELHPGAHHTPISCNATTGSTRGLRLLRCNDSPASTSFFSRSCSRWSRNYNPSLRCLSYITNRDDECRFPLHI